MGFRFVTNLQFKMDKRSGDDDSNKYPVKLKRSSGWARKKETDRQKLKAIAHDKNQQKLNFGFIPSTRPSIEVALHFDTVPSITNNDSTQNSIVNMQPSISEPSCSNIIKHTNIINITKDEMLDMKCSNNESTQDLNVNIQPSIPSSIEFDKRNIVDFGNDIVPNDSLHEDEVAQNSESDLDDNFLIDISSNNFKALSHNSSLAEKLRFMSNHPIQPQYDQLPFNAYKIYFRTLSNTDNTQIPRNWLSFDGKNEKLFCAVCLAFSVNKESISVQGVQVSAKNIYKQIKVHENSKTHDEAVYAYMQAKKVKDVSSLIDINQRNCRVIQVQEHRLFLSRIIEGIIYIGRQGIAYRAHKGEQAYTLDDRSMNHGNFLELLMCWSKFDPILEKYLNIAIEKSKNRSTLSGGRGRGSLVTFLSKTTINKIINLISQWIQEEIGKEVKKAKFYSLLIDSTQDVSVTDQLAVCVRYVIQTEVKERLIQFLPVQSSKAIDLYNLIKNVLEDIGLSLSNIVSQAYDGAANLSGIHNGLQALIKKDAPQSIHTHCFSHLLNLTLTQAADSCSEAINLFGLLDRLAVFFSQSYKRMGMWKQNVIKNSVGSEKMLRLQKIGQTRWWSRDVALNNVFDPLFTPTKEKHRFITVIKALLAVANGKDFDLGAKSEALNIINNLLKFETILTAYVFQSLFVLSSTASSCLQSKKLNYTQGYKLLHNLKSKLIEGVNNFEIIFIRTTEFIEYLQTILEKMDGTDNIFWSSTFMKKRKLFKKKMSGELTADERLVDEKKLFEVEVYKVVYNNALAKLSNRYVLV